jgi:segregation and condensation protein A
MSFEKIFEVCQDRLQAIFLFLSMLELVQLNYMNILIGEGRNNFILEYNQEKPEDPLDDDLFSDDSDGSDGGGDRPADGIRPSDKGGLFPGFLDASAN